MVLFAFSGLFIPPNSFVYAHYDPKGLPPVRVDVELISLNLNDDWDDGIDRDAEIVMGTILAHGEDASHGKSHDVTTWADWDTDKSYDRKQQIDKKIYSHIQCNPKSPVALAFKVMESDQFNPEQTALSLGTGLTAFLTLPTPVNVGVAALGVIISGIAQFNEDDLVGTGVTIIPSSGYKFVDISDDSGKKTGYVYVSVTRTILNEGHEAYEHCKTNASPESPEKPSVAPFLEEAKKAVLSFKGPMGGEKGTENSQLNEKNARNTATKLVLGDIKEVYDSAGNLIDENYLEQNVEQLIDLAIQYEKDGQLDDAAETYLEALEMINGEITNPDSVLDVIDRDNLIEVTGKGGRVIIEDEKSCSATAYFHYVMQEVKNKNVNHLKVKVKVTTPGGETFTTDAKYMDGRFQGRFPAVTFGTYTIEILSTEPWKLENKDTHQIKVVFSPCPGIDTLPMKLADPEPAKPETYYLIPSEPFRIISDIEELTRKTSELLDKQMEKKEQTKKEQKSKNTNKKEDTQVLSGLFSATKWLEYANKMVSDALKQQIKEKPQKELQDGLNDATKQAKDIKQLNTEIKKEAKESKVSQADLNKAAKEPIDKLKSKKQTTPTEKIKAAQDATDKITISLSESAKWLGEILDSDRVMEEELKELPGLADELTVKTKKGYFVGDVCEGHALVTAEWELVRPDGRHPQEAVSIEIDIYDDGKKIHTQKYILADNTATQIYDEKGKSKSSVYDKSMDHDFFYTKYQAKFDPKKGKTVEFKLSDTQRLLPEKYALIESQFPITVKIPSCKIDSVVDDLKIGSLTDQDLPVIEKKSDIKPKSEKSDTKKTTTKTKDDKKDKPKDTKKPKPKDTKTPKASSVEYDSQILLEMYATIKWAEYSQNLLIDAINQYNKELKTQIKQDEQEYANTKDKSIMDAVIEDKDTVKKNDIDLKNLISLEGKLKDYESEIRKEAAKKKMLTIDLNEAAEEPINKIELILPESIDGKLKEAKKVSKELEKALKELREFNEKNFSPITKSTIIKDIEWSSSGTACDDAITITIKWFPNYQHPLAQTGIFSIEVTDDGVVSLKSGVHKDDTITFEYRTTIDPKKGKTVKIDLQAIARDGSFNSRPGSVMSPVVVTIPPCPIDSVVNDLQHIVVIDQDGGTRKDEPKLVGGVAKTAEFLEEILDKVEERMSKSKKTQDKPSTQTPPTPSTAPPTPPASSSQTPPQPVQKAVKLVDRNRSAVQHSVDPCLTTHTIWYQFAFASGGYPAGDKITITESGPRGNLVHKGTLDSQGKYQITIQNPPMQPGFEFRLTEYQSSANKLESALPDVWQFNVGPCIYPGTPGYPSSQPPAEQQSGGGSGQIYFVQMYTINGKDYPIYQFASSAPDNCNDYHFHTSSGKAYAIDGSILNDPAPSGCGYGKTNAMGFTSAGVYKSQITAWESLTGINIPEDD